MRAWNRKRKPKFTTKTKHSFNDLVDRYIFYARHMKMKDFLIKIDNSEKILKIPAYIYAGIYFKKPKTCNI